MNAKVVRNVVRGFAMGAADIVPGVSGGTVALVLGIYERLLDCVSDGARGFGSLLKGDTAGFRRRMGAVDWSFLVPLGAGILTAIALLSSLIQRLLHDRPEEMAGLFFGLVIGSMVVAWSALHERGTAELTVMAVVGAITFVLLGFQSGLAVDPPLWAYFGSGAIAICAMILPGISGSFLLLMMGMYAPVLGAVHDRALVTLVVFALGAAIGLGFFSTGLRRLLDHYHDPVVAGLIGLMVGSLRVLWPWPNGVGVVSDDAAEAVSGTALGWPEPGHAIVPIVLAVIAFVLVVGVSRAAERKPDPATVG
ncbi:MAG: DUF368 domain-containing protein [Acidimicrobiales bacterium]